MGSLLLLASHSHLQLALLITLSRGVLLLFESFWPLGLKSMRQAPEFAWLVPHLDVGGLVVNQSNGKADTQVAVVDIKQWADLRHAKLQRGSQ
jgi:hypothetical protein